jgi:hypothetical protein
MPNRDERPAPASQQGLLGQRLGWFNFPAIQEELHHEGNDCGNDAGRDRPKNDWSLRDFRVFAAKKYQGEYEVRNESGIANKKTYSKRLAAI